MTERILTGRRRLLLLALPVLLPACLAPAFPAAAGALGREAGYLAGFALYWLACLAAPLLSLRPAGLRALFAEPRPLFSRANRLPAALLILIVAVAAALYLPGFAAAPWPLLALALPVAAVNGLCEEVFWRGLYTAAFPRSFWLGVLYPSLAFAAWHLVPQLVFPDPGGPLTFAAMTFPLGLAYAWITARTGSVRWAALAHGLTGFLALGGAIAPSLLSLIWP